MAYNVKYFCDHKTITDSEVTARIEILQDGFAGGSTEVTGWGEVYRLEYERPDKFDIFKQRIRKGRMEFYLAVENSTDLAILTDIVGSDIKEYQLRLKIDSNVVWTGLILPDFTEYSEGDYPFMGRIQAKDLSILEGSDFAPTPSTEDRRLTAIAIIAEFLAVTGLGLEIDTFTSWTQNDIVSSDDVLNQIYHDTRNLRKFGGDVSLDAQGNQNYFSGDEPITFYEALTWMLDTYCLFLVQSNNKWVLSQVSEMSDPTSVKHFTYNSSGVQQTSVTSDITVATGASLIPRPSLSLNTYIAALKQSSVTYAHRTKISSIQLPEIISILAADSPYSQSMFFSSTGDQTVEYNTLILATSDPSATTMRVEWEIAATGYEWDNVAQEWTASSINNYQYLDFIGIDGDGNARWRGVLSVTTGKIPSDADGAITLTITKAETETPAFTAIETQYTQNVFDVLDFNESLDDIFAQQRKVTYQLSQTADQQVHYEYPETYFGDGPAFYTPGALRHGTGDEDTTAENWGYRGGTLDQVLQNLIMTEVMNTQLDEVHQLSLVLRGVYYPHQVLNYNSLYWFFLGGYISGIENEWTADLLQIDIGAGSFTAATINLEGGSSFNVGGRVFSANLSASNAQLQGQGFLARLSSTISGTVTTIPLDRTVTVLDDQQYYIIDQYSLNRVLVTINGNQIATSTITVDSVTLNTRFPQNAYVFLSSGSVASGIISGEFSQQIFADSNAVGVLTAAVDAEVSTLAVELWTQVRSGWEVQLWWAGQTSEETVYVTIAEDSDQGSDTISIVEQQVTAPQDARLLLEGLQLSALFHVDPGEIVQSVSEERTGDSIGRLSANKSGTITTIAFDNLDVNTTFLDNQTLLLVNRFGENEEVTVNGEQTINAPGGTLTVDSIPLTYTYVSGYAWLREPNYAANARITTNSDSIVLKVDVNGNISAVKLSADADGSQITINADQVSINAITFDSDGAMYSDNFDGGITAGVVQGIGTVGWAFDYTGNIYANSGTFRNGTIINSIDQDSFQSGIGGVRIVGALPGSGNFTGEVVFLTTDDKLYRWDGAAWTAAVPTTDLTGTITTAQIGDSQVTTVKLGDSQVTTTKIADTSITEAKIGASSVTTTKIADTAITEAKIGNASVTTTKIGNTAVTEAKIGDLAVGTAKIQAAAVVSAKIAANTIVAGNIASGTITASEIATGTITANEIAANTITAAKIASGTITATEIATNAITSDKILAGAVTAAKISVSSLSAIDTDTGTLTVSDTLTMGASGEITNSGGDYTLDDDGLSIQVPNSFTPPGGTTLSPNIIDFYALSSGTTYTGVRLYGSGWTGLFNGDGSARMNGTLRANNVLTLSTLNDKITLSSSDEITFDAADGFFFDIDDMPTSDPSQTDRVYRRSVASLGGGETVLCISV